MLDEKMTNHAMFLDEVETLQGSLVVHHTVNMVNNNNSSSVS